MELSLPDSHPDKQTGTIWINFHSADHYRLQANFCFSWLHDFRQVFIHVTVWDYIQIHFQKWIEVPYASSKFQLSCIMRSRKEDFFYATTEIFALVAILCFLKSKDKFWLLMAMWLWKEVVPHTSHANSSTNHYMIYYQVCDHCLMHAYMIHQKAMIWPNLNKQASLCCLQNFGLTAALVPEMVLFFLLLQQNLSVQVAIL